LGFAKVCYRALENNTAPLFTTFGLANVYLSVWRSLTTYSAGA
jgi:hypothetical protein